MTTADKCRSIIENILERCNKNPGSHEAVIGFSDDWGGNSLTVFMDGSHTHVGQPGGTFANLVDSLHRLLVHGEGLSLAIPIEAPPDEHN